MQAAKLWIKQWNEPLFSSLIFVCINYLTSKNVIQIHEENSYEELKTKRFTFDLN